MTSEEIKELISYISNSGLNEVNIETNDFKISVKKQADLQAAPPAPVPQAQPPALAAQAEPPVPAPGKVEAEEGASSEGYLEIKAPMIGTFYRSPDPDSGPFVKVGDTIKAGETVCIIEAMKLFNDIESEVDGKIVKVMVDDATPVEYDQVLFLVEPA